MHLFSLFFMVVVGGTASQNFDMSLVEVAIFVASLCDLQASYFQYICFEYLYLAKRRRGQRRTMGDNGDKVLRHHKLAPIGQCDRDGGGKRVGAHLGDPLL